MIHSSSFVDARTLRHKLLLWVLIPMWLILMLNVVLVHQFGLDGADRRHDQYLMNAGRILRDQLRTENGRVIMRMHSGALNVLNADEKYDQVYYFLADEAQGFGFGNADLPMPAEPLSETSVYYAATYQGKPVRMMAAIVPESDVPSGRVIIVVAKTMVLHDIRAREWMWNILPLHLLLTIFVGFMMWWGVGRGLRPILKLQDELTRRSAQDLSPLPEQQVVLELQPLIRGFNGLMARLGDALRLQQNFVADAAHQLRTPLAGLKAQAELALCLTDSVEIQHSLMQMRRAADHAAHLGNQLLMLARAEPGRENYTAQTEFDLGSLVRNCTEYWVPKALHKKIDLGFERGVGDCSIEGYSALLHEMLGNLIDNALRYTPEGGRVTVRVARINENVVLEIEDNGPGIPEAERKNVFKRFYRLLGSHQDGCGLGLSIVQEICDRHHALVSILAGAEKKGTLFRIMFKYTQRSDIGQASGAYHKLS
jgi:two-component system sensor histidine kinase TctE